MTDPKPDVCRVMAESLWDWSLVPHYFGLEDQETSSKREYWKEKWIAEMTEALRNHTIVPEMVEFIAKISDCTREHIISRRAEIRADARILLAKAEGGNDD